MATRMKATKEELDQQLAYTQQQLHLWQMAYQDEREGAQPVAIQRWSDEYGKYTARLYGVHYGCGGYVVVTYRSRNETGHDQTDMNYWDAWRYAAQNHYSLDMRIAAERLQIAYHQATQKTA